MTGNAQAKQLVFRDVKSRNIKKGRRKAGPEDGEAAMPLRRCQLDCRSRCCRYITVVLPAPRRKVDFDELSWFLAHEDTSVYVEARRWHLEVRTRCKYLNHENLCEVYDHRPQVCRDYDVKSCEYPERPMHAIHFDSREEFDQWRAQRKQARRERRGGRTVG